ncbi:MAG TPA: sensor histidine kinase [Nocardioidaceae bacterium]|nr:sensor histidine kinase [Nocardioidaceae bacterium]
MRNTAQRLEPIQRWGSAHPWLVDAGLTLLLVLVGLLTTSSDSSADPAGLYRERDAAALALISASTLPYVARRRAPTTVFFVTVLSVLALMFSGYNEGGLPWVLLVGAYSTAAHRPAREVVAALLLMTALLCAALLAGLPRFGAGELVTTAAGFAAAAVLGRTSQTRQERLAAVDERQREAASRAAADERLRIAQELHDIVAHSLGVIAVQAGVGMHVLDSDPVEARRSFETISRTSRASLSEIRRLLGVVRTGASYAPAPGLADLPRLADEVADAGLAVDLDVESDLADVPRSVGLAAFRIVQESLTNSLRHADARQATVRLGREPGSLVVEVHDDGRGPDGRKRGGHGLVGMQERVAVHGGSLETGPGRSGGFRVLARLPFAGERSA